MKVDSAVKHIPGPWTVSDEFGWSLDIIAPWGDEVKPARASGYGDYRGITVCTLAHQKDNPCVSKDQAEANARLIAAAPVLLEALEQICAEAESWHSMHDHDGNGCVQCDSICKLIPKMQVAIKLAKGESL